MACSIAEIAAALSERALLREGVAIGDDVELGANCTIHRDTIHDTRLGDGTRIDNLMMVGHNVRIGRGCLLCGVGGHRRAHPHRQKRGAGRQDRRQRQHLHRRYRGHRGGAIVLSNTPAGRMMPGHPAMKMDTTTEVSKGLRRRRRLFYDVAALKKTVSKDRADG